VTSLLHDLRLAFRGFRRRPAFTAAAVASLALGIGASTAIFAVVYGVLLRPLPFAEPDRLMTVSPRFAGPGGFAPESWSYPYFEAFRASQQSFSAVAAYAPAAFNLAGEPGEADVPPERVHGEYVSAEYFPVLGVAPVVGRTFTETEDRVTGSPPVAVLGHDLWRRRFASDPSAVGRQVVVDGLAVRVVGVMPAGFAGVPGRTEIWLPMSAVPRLLYARKLQLAFSFWHQVVGRRAAGVTPEKVAASLEATAARVAANAPAPDWAPDAHLVLDAVPTRDLRVSEGIESRLLLLLGTVVLVLLVACANVANLLLSRGVGRRREFGVRAALGADGGRLVRQLLVEAVALGAAGGAAGWGLAWAGVGALRVLRPASAAGEWTLFAVRSALGDVRLDPPVLLFGLAAALAAALLVGLVPAFQARREGRGAGLGERGIAAARALGLRRLSVRGVLVVVQVLLAAVLLASAGLMLRSFRQVLARDPGFEPAGVLTAQLRLPRADYSSEAEQTATWRSLLDRIGTLPGVTAASLDTGLPLADDSMIGEVRTPEENRPAPPEGSGDPGPPAPAVRVHAAAPGHFRVLGAPVLRGRGVEPSDAATSHRVAIVSRTAAEALWPGQDPLGRRLWLSIGWDEDDWAEVVGVVGDVRYTGIEAGAGGSAEEGGPTVVGDVYVPFAQVPGLDSAYLLVRTAGDPLALAPGLRERVREVDPSLPLFDVMSLDERVARAYSEVRFSAFCLGAFALAALLLAALGVYGVMAYSVSERTAEMGVRMSLGARPVDIARMVIGDGLVLTVVGLVLGVGAALALGGVLRHQLVGVAPTDPLAFAGAAVVLLASALLAAWLPARRAARLDPTEAIRRE